MSLPSFEEFEKAAKAKGAKEAIERVWDADSSVPTHTHPFSADALVVQGEMWLTVGDETRHLRPRDTFRLDAGTPHAERYGSEGATLWVGRS